MGGPQRRSAHGTHAARRVDGCQRNSFTCDPSRQADTFIPYGAPMVEQRQQQVGSQPPMTMTSPPPPMPAHLSRCPPPSHNPPPYTPPTSHDALHSVPRLELSRRALQAAQLGLSVRAGPLLQNQSVAGQARQPQPLRKGRPPVEPGGGCVGVVGVAGGRGEGCGYMWVWVCVCGGGGGTGRAIVQAQAVVVAW